MKINFPLPASVRDALGAQGSEWDPVLLESVQPVIVVPLAAVSQASASPLFADAVTEALQAFSGGAALVGAAGNWSHVQLLNPAGSGRVVYVDEVVGALQAGTAEASVYRENAVLTTLVGACPNKFGGGPASVSVIRTQNAGALIPAGMRIGIGTMVGSPIIRFNPAVRLVQGEGLVIAPNPSNHSIVAAFQFREVAA